VDVLKTCSKVAAIDPLEEQSDIAIHPRRLGAARFAGVAERPPHTAFHDRQESTCPSRELAQLEVDAGAALGPSTRALAAAVFPYSTLFLERILDDQHVDPLPVLKAFAVQPRRPRSRCAAFDTTIHDVVVNLLAPELRSKADANRAGASQEQEDQ
jgi:hypothetical protein